jgi:ring-1,2-phenylacetyl-CoA epoxidase subunit PaaA
MATVADREERLRHERLLEKIRSGEKIESPDEMTEEYRENLIHLMTMQADSELAGAFGYVPWIQKAPTIDEKLIVANIVKDEVRHATAIYRLLRELGVPVDEMVAQNDYMYRVAMSEGAGLGMQRITRDKRVNIFYYPIDTWADFVMFNFTMDRGAGHQLEDALHCSYGPWARAMVSIMKEEVMHIHHGDLWVERFAKGTAEQQAEIQAALDRWYPRVMNIFGRPHTPKNQLYRKLGLKLRDNQEVREAFVNDIRPKLDAWGLRLPEWTPPWIEQGKELRYDEARDEMRYAAG